MKLLIQRVKKAHVAVNSQTVGSIDQGLLVFLGIHVEDTADAIPWLVEKCLHLRIFEDEDKKMNRSVLDVNGSILLVSQFTLYGDCQKGRRPSFTQAALPTIARPLYDAFITIAPKTRPFMAGINGAGKLVRRQLLFFTRLSNGIHTGSATSPGKITRGPKAFTPKSSCY